MEHGGNAAYIRCNAGESQQHSLAEDIGGVFHNGRKHKSIGAQKCLLHLLGIQASQKTDVIRQAVFCGIAAQIPVVGLLQ